MPTDTLTEIEELREEEVVLMDCLSHVRSEIERLQARRRREVARAGRLVETAALAAGEVRS